MVIQSLESFHTYLLQIKTKFEYIICRYIRGVHSWKNRQNISCYSLFSVESLTSNLNKFANFLIEYEKQGKNLKPFVMMKKSVVEKLMMQSL